MQALSTQLTHPESLPFGEIQSPLGLALVVDEKARIENELSVLECSVVRALLEKAPSLYGLGEVKSKGSSPCYCHG